MLALKPLFAAATAAAAAVVVASNASQLVVLQRPCDRMINNAIGLVLATINCLKQPDSNYSAQQHCCDVRQHISLSLGIPT
jgi:hypothetical protein